MTVQLTDKAKEMIEKLADECGTGGYTVRCLTRGGGCSGLTNDLYYLEEEMITELDDVFEFDGVKVVVDQFSQGYLGDFTLDFIDTPMNSGFKFVLDKQATTSCGCGSSFNVV